MVDDIYILSSGKRCCGFINGPEFFFAKGFAQLWVLWKSLKPNRGNSFLITVLMLRDFLQNCLEVYWEHLNVDAIMVDDIYLLCLVEKICVFINGPEFFLQKGLYGWFLWIIKPNCNFVTL